jgi:hypothetical protein
VAIVQISRITQRKGLEEDLPQPLASAELGWAMDQRRLFIGNGTLAEGAPVVGNTEILTEFSDILALATSYTYQGAAGGYTVQTGVSPGTPVTQSLQNRLDSMAMVTDFGATGDGITDDTAAINRALFQLFCVQTNPQIRRSLFFPAGVYVISDTILIPPYCRIYGEGANSSIIRFQAQLWAANTAYQAGVLVKYDNGTILELYRSKKDVPATGIGINNIEFWETVASLPPWVARTADSLQQTGLNIGTNGAAAPRNVEIQDLCFETQESANDSSLGNNHSIFLVEQAQQVSLVSTNLLGPLSTADLTTDTEEMMGLGFASSAARLCTNITVTQCKFSGTSYGVKTDDGTRGVTISSSWFQTLYQGIVLGDSSPQNGGPSGFKICHNVFDNIYAQGVIMTGCSLNGTAYNAFYDVGNEFFGYPVSQVRSTPVIVINADNNVSVGDTFQRTDTQALTQPRIQIYNSVSGTVPTSMATTNGVQSQLGAYVRASGQQEPILNAQSDTELFTVDTSVSISQGGFRAFRMEYTMYRLTAGATAVRTGTLTVVASGSGDVEWNDEYTQNDDTNVTLLVSETDDVITISYDSNNTGYNGTIYYSVTHLA